MILHKNWMVGVSIGLTIGLAGCGGGGGGNASTGTPPTGSTPAPAPTLSPTPTPPPPPAPLPIAGPIGLTQLQSFPTLTWASSGYTTRLDGSDRQGATTRDPTRQVEFEYLSAEQAYDILIPGFLRGRVEARGQSGDQRFTAHRVREASAPFERFISLNLFRPGAGNPRLALSYTSLGYWQGSHIDPSTPDRIQQNFGDFVYGVPTVAGDVPAAGTAIYDALVFGDGGFIEGEARLAIDFTAGSISGYMEATLNDGIGGLSNLGRYQLTDIVYTAGGTTFTGRISVPGATAETFIEGRFTGPQASELMVRWSARLPDPHNPPQTRIFYGLWIGKRG